MAVLLVGLVALQFSVVLQLICPRPPAVHDEFSYLLAADTFASGRTVNPPHPMWQHFESFHINHRPTYGSIYPPAQGLFLAAGQLIAGDAMVGVWISMALACAAVCWMLQAWMPPRWALIGGLLAATHVDLQQWWGHTYWGGAVTMLGGALLFGAMRRILRQPSVRDSLLMAVGLVILANSRPFEGLLVSLPVAAVLAVWMFGKHGPAWRVSLSRVVAPVLLVLVAATATMAVYNHRATGDPLLMPYMLNSRAYGVTPVFIWQDANLQTTFRHQVMADYHFGWALKVHENLRTLPGFGAEALRRGKLLWQFFIGLVLLFPLAALPWMINDRWMRFTLLILGLLLAALLQTIWMLPHYASPVVGLIFVVVVQGMRHLRLWRWRGLWPGRIVLSCLMVVYFLVLPTAMFVNQSRPGYSPWALHQRWGWQREKMLTALESSEGRDLVIVSYGTDEWHGPEWVYNGARIDDAEVVWARDIDPQQNGRLFDYYPDRRRWLLEADVQPCRLVPYPDARGVDP